MIPFESTPVLNKGISPHGLHSQLTGSLFNTHSNELGSPPTDNAQETAAAKGSSSQRPALSGGGVGGGWGREPKGSSITELNICFLLLLAPREGPGEEKKVSS